MSFDNGEEQLLTIKEVASLLRVHPDTVRRWVRNKSIPAHRYGNNGTIRLLMSEIETPDNELGEAEENQLGFGHAPT